MEIYIKLWQNAKRDEANHEQNSRVNASEEVVGHHAPGSWEFFEAVDAKTKWRKKLKIK